jgi:hypothetical protein
MHSLRDREQRVRLWFDGRHRSLVDLFGNPIAAVRGDLVYSLRFEPVAFWRNGIVLDLDGTVLLRRGLAEDRPKPRVVIPLRIEPSVETKRPTRKPWGSELALIECLRLIGLDYQLNGPAFLPESNR